MNEPATRSLIDWVLRKHPDTPKNRAKQWILAGRVSVKGTVVRKPHHILPDPGDALELGNRHTAGLDCGSGWQIHPRVSLLYLDADVAVVNKGAGLLSVPDTSGKLSALSILADYLAGKLKVRDRNASARTLPSAIRRLKPLPVHRLDQFTSGVFCMAMNPTARNHLIAQLRTHAMRREYVAFVDGRPDVQKGTWRQWLHLGRDDLHPQVVSKAPSAESGTDIRDAITHFEVIEEFPSMGSRGVVTKLHLRLETGRKHQIRVQAAHAGLPIIGDRTYNPAYTGNSTDKMAIEFQRQALHAVELSLEHPAQPGRRLTWTAAFPEDLRRLEAGLRRAAR